MISKLHHAILSQVIETGYAPGLSELSKLLGAPEEEVEKGLYDLQEYHGVVLHPHEPRVWVIHPFSLVPTPFIVKSEKGEWWGNCAWCSLGVAALLKDDAEIISSIGAHGEPVKLHIKDGEVAENELLVHFPVPMKNAWDNVIYTCSTMLLFRNKEEIRKWSSRHGIPVGDIQKVSKIWAFSKKWYGNHLDPEWKKWTVEEAGQIFEEFELNHPVWRLEGSDSRF